MVPIIVDAGQKGKQDNHQVSVRHLAPVILLMDIFSYHLEMPSLLANIHLSISA